jgi:acetyl esterase/lipase
MPPAAGAMLYRQFIYMKQIRSVIAVFLGVICLTACSTSAQTVNIWPGQPPGTESWTVQEKVYENTPVGTVVMNVSTPTLTAYLPKKSDATGTGVIISPGGYCVALAISQEGDAARWLQSKGIAAFVLKYRIPEKKGDGIPKDLDMDQACKYGSDDEVQAIKVVRQHAAEWSVSPDRVGVLGFSAGGMVANASLFQQDDAARPDFGALIYGAPFGKMPAIPAKLPPMFMAWAQDDNVAGTPIAKYFDALRAAGQKPEVHIYSAGGHGFGMKKQGTSSDRWIDDFYNWLESQGLTKRASADKK